MINQKALKAEIIRNGMTQESVAKSIGMSTATFWRKMKAGTFGIDEVERLIDLLHISDPVSVFLCQKSNLPSCELLSRRRVNDQA